MNAVTEDPLAYALLQLAEDDDEEDVDVGPTRLYELGTAYSTVTDVPGPPRVPELGREPNARPARPATRPTEEELARRGWSIPLSLPSPSMLVGARTSRRPTVRAPNARPSLQPTLPPQLLPELLP